MSDRATHVTFATVAEVLDIKGPTIKPVLEDATNHSSGGWEEKVPVLMSGGKVSFEVNFIAADATQSKTTGLVAAALAKTKETFQLIFPDSTGFAFSAYVSMDFDAPVKKPLRSKVDLDITGVVTTI